MVSEVLSQLILGSQTAHSDIYNLISQAPAAISTKVTGIAYGRAAANGIFSASEAKPFIEHNGVWSVRYTHCPI